MIWRVLCGTAESEKRMYFDVKEFGKRLHDVRTSRGITQEELAVRLGQMCIRDREETV